jgi:hypothetical protein
MDQILDNLLLANIKESYMVLKIKFFLAYLKIFLFRLVLRLRGIIVALPIMIQSKNFPPKSYCFCITNIEIVQNSKSKPKKFSFLCTFKYALKGTVRPDWICMRVVPLESPLKGHQPLYVFDFLFLIWII